MDINKEDTNMKRIAALLLAALCALTLITCGGTKEPQKENTEGFETITVVENGDYAVRITGVEYDHLFGETVYVYLENKTAFTSYDVAVTDASVNCVEWSPFFTREIKPGEKKNEKIQFVNEELRALITDYTDIELTFKISKTDDSGATTKETVHVYPKGKENARPYVHKGKSEDVVLIEEQGMKATLIGKSAGNGWAYILNLYLENANDFDVTFGAMHATINGKSCDPFWGSTVRAGKVKYVEIGFTQEDFDTLGISSVESIELDITAFDTDGTGGGFYYEKTVTIVP
jgi:hypothetical protein